MERLARLGFVPRLVMFDLDGTLVDSAADIAYSLSLALTDMGLSAVDELRVRRWVGRGASRLVMCALDAQALPHALHDELLQGFLQHYSRHVCVFSSVYPGVMDAMLAFAAEGAHLACVTNKPYAPARDLLDALGLLDGFSLLLGGDTLPQKKPHPAPLLHCLSYFDVRPAQALMVGDSVNDIEAARAAGIKSLAVSYGYNHGENIADSHPDWLVGDLRELL